MLLKQFKRMASSCNDNIMLKNAIKIYIDKAEYHSVTRNQISM